MLPLGHLGIGSRIVRPFARGLRLKWILLGTVLPDLIDKPLYYGLVLLTDQRGAELGQLTMISGTRTVGHTGILILLIAAVATWKRSRPLVAVCLGMLSHLLLDSVGDYFIAHYGTEVADSARTIHAILFPFLGWRFPVMPFSGASEHVLGAALAPFNLIGEVLGGAILAWEWWKWRHRSEILGDTHTPPAKR